MAKEQGWALTGEPRFICDGWNLISEVQMKGDAADAPNPGADQGGVLVRSGYRVRSYLWGLDVNGTFGGAGGVGGLLWVADYVPGISGSNRQLAPWYDGNGNIMGWVENEGAQMLPLHRLEYDPFGRLLVEDDVRVSHTKKQRDLGVQPEWLDRPPFGFSTKYEDPETGMLYYGYRYYKPETGRWPSRDPIEERGGLNLYGMVGNDAVNRWDRLGLEGGKNGCENIKITKGASVYDVFGGGYSISLKYTRCCCPAGGYSHSIEGRIHLEGGIGLGGSSDDIPSERIGAYVKIPLGNVDVPIKWNAPCGQASQTVDANVEASLEFSLRIGGGLGISGGEYNLFSGKAIIRFGGEFVIDSRVLNIYSRWELSGTRGGGEFGIGPFSVEIDGSQENHQGEIFSIPIRLGR